MKIFASLTRHALALAFGVLCVSGQVLAADNNKGKSQDHNDQGENRNGAMHGKFAGTHKDLVREYFSEQMRKGGCPPGLAKKNNGCNPPGQVKQWQMGQSLQQDVGYRVLPADLSRLLGEPEQGYHYGMVDSDILLLMDGSEMVMDAISSLGQ